LHSLSGCEIESLFQEILRCCQQLFPTKIQLIEEILRDFVRLEPEAVENYGELGDKRAKAPKFTNQD
jgi:hypothetical protein